MRHSCQSQIRAQKPPPSFLRVFAISGSLLVALNIDGGSVAGDSTRFSAYAKTVAILYDATVVNSFISPGTPLPGVWLSTRLVLEEEIAPAKLKPLFFSREEIQRRQY